MRLCVLSYRKAIICLIVFFLIGGIATPSWSRESDKSRYRISDADLKQVRESGILESGGYVYIYAQNRPSTQSSGAMVKAHVQAELEAKHKLLEKRFLDRVQAQMKQIPEKYRQDLSLILAHNFAASASLTGFVSARSGVDSGTAWVVLVGPLDGINLKGQETIRDMMENIIRGRKKTMSAEQADVFFEVSEGLGIPQAKEYWLLCQPELLKPQLLGQPVDQALRWWVRNEAEVLSILPAAVSIADLKNCMILLPRSQKVNDTLIARYTREGMFHCAGAARLRGRLFAGTTDAILKNVNMAAFEEALRSGNSTRPLIRVILVANGQMPTKEEPVGGLYAEALAEYTVNSPVGVKEKVFQALDESINADTLNLYGAVMRRLGYYELAAVLCRQACTIRPDHPYALINEALCMEALKRPNDAKRLASLAVQNGNLDAWGWAEARRIMDGN